MSCCCWSLPVGENPPTMFNAVSFTDNGELRWSVLWESLMPNQGGMRVITDRIGRRAVFILDGELTACGIKDNNLHVATLDPSDGSEVLALTDTGVTVEDYSTGGTGVAYVNGEVKVVGTYIVFSNFEDASSGIRLARYETDNNGNASRVESGGNLSEEGDALFFASVAGLTDAGEAWLVQQRKNPSTSPALVSVDSSGESGRYTFTQTTSQNNSFLTRVASRGETVYFLHTYADGSGGFGFVDYYAKWMSAAAPFGATPSTLYTDMVSDPLGSADVEYMPFNLYLNNEAYGPLGADPSNPGNIWYFSEDEEDYVVSLDVASPLTEQWKVDVNDLSTLAVSALPTISQTRRDIAANGTLFLGISQSGNLALAATESDGTIIAGVASSAPGYVGSTTGNNINSIDNNTLYVSYTSNESPTTAKAMARYEVSGGLLIEAWRWFGGNALCPSADGSGNSYFADAIPHDLSNLGKYKRVFTILIDDTDWTFNDIQAPSDESFLRATLEDTVVTQVSAGSSDFEGQLSDTQGGTTELTIDMLLTVSAGTTDGFVNLSLAFTIDGGTELNGDGPGVDTTITYTLDDADLYTSDPQAMTTTASEAARTIEFDSGPPPEQMILPDTLYITTQN